MSYMTHWNMCIMTHKRATNHRALLRKMADKDIYMSHICYMTHWHMCIMTHSHVWHDSLTCVKFKSVVGGSSLWRDTLVCVTWQSLCAWCYSCKCETWLIHMCDMTHSYVWRDWSYVRDVSYPYVWHDSSICVTFKSVIGGTVWRRPIGCLKLRVIFSKRATHYRALLRKMTFS